MTTNDELLIRSLAALGENRTDDPAVEQHLAEFHAAYAKLDTDPTTAAQLDAMVTEIDLELHDTQEAAAPLPGVVTRIAQTGSSVVVHQADLLAKLQKMRSERVNDVIHNSGFMATGGAITNVGQLAAGPGAGITNAPGSEPARSASRSRGIGVVAIKATEARAVIEVFGLTRNRETPSGQDFYTGTVESADGTVELVAARTLEQGQRSIMPTLEYLRRHSNPAVFVLVGIGGAINRDLVVGDVVVATRVVYYDLRREMPDEVHRRGEDRPAPAAITHAVNSFFTDYHDPARLESVAGPFRVLSGPIGSGDAVVMDAESQIRKFLLAYNEKVLAVDMEAGGLTQFCHETPPPDYPGWLVVRGISDLADHTKTYDHQHSAAHNAALTLRHLIPYLPANA